MQAATEVAPTVAPVKAPKAAKPAKSPKAAKGTKIPRVKTPAAHPTYTTMVVEAIKHLKERKGSSKIAILKYVSSHFNVGEHIVKVNTRIRDALKKGVANKQFVQTVGNGASGSFRLAAVDPTAKKPVTKKPKKAATGEKKVKKAATGVKKAATGEKKAKKPSATKKAATGEKKAKTTVKKADKVKKVKSPKKIAKPAAKKVAKSPAKKAAPKKVAAAKPVKKAAGPKA